MTQDRHKRDHTHLWYRGELPICVKCGESPISLGQWGDTSWKKTHNKWKKPCKIADEDKDNFKHPDLYKCMIEKGWGIMTQNEHKNLIVELARLFKPKVYVELGVGSGYVFNAVLPYVKIRAMGIDVNLAKFNYQEYDRQLKEYKGPIIDDVPFIVNEMSTDDGAKLWPAYLTIDLLFIDANHSAEQVRKDFITWSKFVTPGTGLVLLHDTYPCGPKYLKPGYCNDAWKVADNIHMFDRDNLEFYETFNENYYEIVTLPGPRAGLSIIRKRGNHHLHWMENK